MLGRVHRHRAEHDDDGAFRLTEAAQLDRTLVALDTVLQEPTMIEHGPEYADNAVGSARNCQAFFLRLDKPPGLVNSSFFFEKA